MKSIPVQLQTHLESEFNTWCFLIKIRSVGAFQGRKFGFASLDADLVYNDGVDTISYVSENGMNLQAVETSADFSVGTSDMVGWVSDDGINADEVRQGLLDFAEVTIYRVNYMNLSMGHEIVGYGTCGQAKFSGKKWTIEFRSLTQQLKQTMNKAWSLTCRAQYGDDKCKMPFVWVNGTVLEVLDISGRTFRSDLSLDSSYDLGVLNFLTGANANLEMELDSWRGTTATLAMPMAKPLAVGDTFRTRVDCDKTFATCKAKGNVLNNRSEHLTPVSETGLGVPGAYITTVSS